MCSNAWHESQAGSHDILSRAKVHMSALHTARYAKLACGSNWEEGWARSCTGHNCALTGRPLQSKSLQRVAGRQAFPLSSASKSDYLPLPHSDGFDENQHIGAVPA